MKKAAILGATGMVGQIFVQLLSGHPWFARARSEAGAGYAILNGVFVHKELHLGVGKRGYR
jgi:aspartate-semialdehyde dehydrogenase